jgi:hypothetical protein
MAYQCLALGGMVHRCDDYPEQVHSVVAEEDTFDLFDPVDVARVTTARQERHAQQEDQTARVLRARQEAYRRVFTASGDLDIVLDDLARFCRGNRTAFDPDPRIHALLTGRQETWIRIMDHLRLSLDDLIERYTGGGT